MSTDDVEHPAVKIVVRRNQNGSVLAFEDRDRAARLLAAHREVLAALYDLVDRRHGSDGETVARVLVDPNDPVVDEIDVCNRFRRDLGADRALAIADDLRAAAEGQLVTDGGQSVGGMERLPNLYEQAKEMARDDPTLKELSNALMDLPCVFGLLVDGEDEDWRPTTITVEYDADDYGRDTDEVIEVMCRAGWRLESVTFGRPQLHFEERDGAEVDR